MPTNQTPDALAEEIKDAVGEYANLIRMGHVADAITVLSKLIADTDRLRDMAASGAKDAERYRLLKEKSRGATPVVRVLIIERGQYIHHVNPDDRLDAIAATKRGAV
jgi:hypothetical protein